MGDCFVYAYVKCGRKAWHLGDAFDSWEEFEFDRGDYVEHHTFRKAASCLTDKDRELAAEFAMPFAHSAE